MPFINETIGCVQTEKEMEGKVYELLILISTWSVAPASYGNGSASLDVSSEQRLLFETVHKEAR